MIIPLFKRKKPDPKRATITATRAAIILTASGAIHYAAARWRVTGDTVPVAIVMRMVAACASCAITRLDPALTATLNGWLTANGIAALLAGLSYHVAVPGGITYTGSDLNGHAVRQRYDWLQVFTVAWPVAAVMGYVPGGQLVDMITRAL